MAVLALLGIGLSIGLIVLTVKTRQWIQAVIIATPGVLLAIEGAQGQIGPSKAFGVFMMFFAIGALLIGAPLVGLYRLWLRYKIKAG